MRGLILAAIAVALGVVASSLLRTERPASAGAAPAPEGGGRCAARTRSGAPCSRAAEPGSDRCWQHG